VSKRNFVFRVDSGLNIGTGHIARCVTLAKMLSKNEGIRCVFIVRPHLDHVS
jgi:spore coat polysaccharide biosynthesis predicted glycosyltransferase SpsG